MAGPILLLTKIEYFHHCWFIYCTINMASVFSMYFIYQICRNLSLWLYIGTINKTFTIFIFEVYIRAHAGFERSSRRAYRVTTKKWKTKLYFGVQNTMNYPKNITKQKTGSKNTRKTTKSLTHIMSRVAFGP